MSPVAGRSPRVARAAGAGGRPEGRAPSSRPGGVDRHGDLARGPQQGERGVSPRRAGGPSHSAAGATARIDGGAAPAKRSTDATLVWPRDDRHQRVVAGERRAPFRRGEPKLAARTARPPRAPTSRPCRSRRRPRPCRAAQSSGAAAGSGSDGPRPLVALARRGAPGRGPRSRRRPPSSRGSGPGSARIGDPRRARASARRRRARRRRRRLRRRRRACRRRGAPRVPGRSRRSETRHRSVPSRAIATASPRALTTYVEPRASTRGAWSRGPARRGPPLDAQPRRWASGVREKPVRATSTRSVREPRRGRRSRSSSASPDRWAARGPRPRRSRATRRRERAQRDRRRRSGHRFGRRTKSASIFGHGLARGRREGAGHAAVRAQSIAARDRDLLPDRRPSRGTAPSRSRAGHRPAGACGAPRREARRPRRRRRSGGPASLARFASAASYPSVACFSNAFASSARLATRLSATCTVRGASAAVPLRTSTETSPGARSATDFSKVPSALDRGGARRRPSRWRPSPRVPRAGSGRSSTTARAPGRVDAEGRDGDARADRARLRGAALRSRPCTARRARRRATRRRALRSPPIRRWRRCPAPLASSVHGLVGDAHVASGERPRRGSGCSGAGRSSRSRPRGRGRRRARVSAMTSSRPMPGRST